MRNPHPFAEYVRILGRGKRGARSLTEDEAQAAMAMILRGEAEPVQLGAFLMLLRVKQESPEELAGLVRAARAMLPPWPGPRVDLDWGAYAGKRRQPPWFLLAARLLARNGVRVLMHGAAAGPERVSAAQALAAIGAAAAGNPSEAAVQLQASGFAYLPLPAFAPGLAGLMDLRALLGLRSPVHTLARMLDPAAAVASLQAVFHPGYQALHSAAAARLGDRIAVFKGDSGEAEYVPDRPCRVHHARAGLVWAEDWPARFARPQLRPQRPDPQRLRGVWEGEDEDPYAAAAVVGTAAIALRVLGCADSPQASRALAQAMWARRHEPAAAKAPDLRYA